MTAALFFVGFVAGCLMAIARHPIYGLVTYVGVFYLHPPSRWWGNSLPDLRWSMLAAGVTLIAVLIHANKDSQAIPLFKHRVMVGLIVFVAWLGIQTSWALDQVLHQEAFTMYAKFALLVALIYKSIDSKRHLKYFLWAHVLGCEYLGWIAFTSYGGGRFEGFGGPGINEANSGALQIVTGIFAGIGLFLAGRARERASVLACAPLIVNAVVTTVSRSGFLAMLTGALTLNLYAPPRLRKGVMAASALGAVLLLALSNDAYWNRIESIKHAGEEVQGVDTGAGRLEIIEQQWQMFLTYPQGCGHRCTAVLSPAYFSDDMLTGIGANRARSSHNTFMSLLVEQGVIGAVLYALFIVWIWRSLRLLMRQYRDQRGFIPAMLPSVASILVAISIGDMFVDYLKFEGRIWFTGVLMVLLNFAAQERQVSTESARSMRPVEERIAPTRARAGVQYKLRASNSTEDRKT